jgi:hypothetical protein
MYLGFSGPFRRLGAGDRAQPGLMICMRISARYRRSVVMSREVSPGAAVVAGLVRSDPHGPAITRLKKEHVRLTHDGMMFDYIAKAGNHRTIVVRAEVVLPTGSRPQSPRCWPPATSRSDPATSMGSV